MTSPDPSRHSQPARVQPLVLGELDPAPSGAPVLDPALTLGAALQGGNPLHQVKATLTVCVGRTEVAIGDLLSAREHQVLALDQALDHPVEVLLEGQVVARGVLVAVGDRFGVRITELPKPLAP